VIRPPRNTVLVGDALDQLRTLPTASIDLVLTSPPWFALRNYDVEGQIGLEESVDEWVSRLRVVMIEIRRVPSVSTSSETGLVTESMS
jgi:site-specific DNA-methyltransferase (adenine-specific)